MFLIAESTAKKSRRRKQNKEKTSPEVWIHQNFCLEWRQKAKKSLSLTPSEEIDALLFLKLSKKRQFDKIWIV